jgi:hypothetical protein
MRLPRFSVHEAVVLVAIVGLALSMAVAAILVALSVGRGRPARRG